MYQMQSSGNLPECDERLRITQFGPELNINITEVK